MAVFVADEQDVAVDIETLRRLAAFVLAHQRVPDTMELSVLCVAPDVIAELNRHHMDADRPTDVLAFPMDLPGEALGDEPAVLGDVVLCPAVAVEQAPRHGKSATAELELLLVHGILHLLGHDHAEPDERDVMFGLTDRILADFSSGGPAPPGPPGTAGAPEPPGAGAEVAP